MNVSRLKQHNKFLRRAEGMLSANPVVSSGLALPFIVMGTTDMRSAVAISFTMLTVNMIVSLLAAIMKKKNYNNTVCMIAAMITASLVIVASSYIVKSIHLLVFELMGIYFPLLAVNTLTFFIVSHSDAQMPIMHTFWRAIRYSLGFIMVALPISFFRELIGKGSLFGYKIGVGVQVPSVLMPFFGFIIVGLFCAGCKYSNRLWQGRLLKQERKLRALEKESGGAQC